MHRLKFNRYCLQDENTRLRELRRKHYSCTEDSFEDEPSESGKSEAILQISNLKSIINDKDSKYNKVNELSESKQVLRFSNKSETVLQILNSDAVVGNSDFKDKQKQSTELKQFLRFSDLEYFDDGKDMIYKLGEPFDKLSQLMSNVHKDKIKKRVIRKGNGAQIQSDATVIIEYKAYTEFQLIPFDSISKNNSYTISLSQDQSLPGINIAIQTMETGEIAQFLMKLQLAYGNNKLFNLVSPEDIVLFIIEIKRVTNLNESTSFRDLFILVNAVYSKGNELFSKGLFKQAIREYKNAASQLEMARICSDSDLEKQSKLLLRLYTNLVISFTKIQEPRNTCTYSEMVYNMCRSAKLKVPIKVYINHARCLVLLSDLKQANSLLRKAKQLDPFNQEIVKEIFKLGMVETESTVSKVSVNSICLKTKTPVEISQQFKEATTEYCIDLLNDYEKTEYQLPNDLNKAEEEFMLAEMKNHGLYLKQSEVNGVTKFFISKRRTLH